MRPCGSQPFLPASLTFPVLRNFQDVLEYGKTAFLILKLNLGQGKHCEPVWFMSLFLFQGSLSPLFIISQVTVLTAYIILCSTLFMTLINLVITTVCEHLLWARFSTKPIIRHNWNKYILNLTNPKVKQPFRFSVRLYRAVSGIPRIL